jgi:hypothetical protein
MNNTLKPVSIAHHRNGVSGCGFHVGIVDDEGEKKLIIQFDGMKNCTAVFDLEKLKQEKINFGENSFRGDYYADDFAEILKEVMQFDWETEQNE